VYEVLEKIKRGNDWGEKIHKDSRPSINFCITFCKQKQPRHLKGGTVNVESWKKQAIQKEGLIFRQYLFLWGTHSQNPYNKLVFCPQPEVFFQEET